MKTFSKIVAQCICISWNIIRVGASATIDSGTVKGQQAYWDANPCPVWLHYRDQKPLKSTPNQFRYIIPMNPMPVTSKAL